MYRVVVYWTAVAAAAVMCEASEAAEGGGLGCSPRHYTYRVTQSDSLGRVCWDRVTVLSCYGRCDSNEISDWRFPYKRSFHPVCLYGEREVQSVILAHCEEGAEPGTEIHRLVSALSCRCHVCRSSEASCQALGGHLVPGSDTWKEAQLAEIQRLT